MKKSILLISLFVMSCSPQLSFIPLDSQKKYPEISVKEVDGFLSENELPKEHEKLGIIECRNLVINDEVYSDAKDLSAEMGGNGIILIKEVADGGFNVSFDPFNNFGFRKTKNIQFLSVRFKKDGYYPIPKKNKDIDDTYN